MFNRNTLRKVVTTLALGLACAATWAGGVHFQKSERTAAPVVVGTSVAGSVVVVTVSNSGSLNQVVTVEVVAVVDGVTAVGVEVATVDARSTESVAVEFAGQVGAVITVGLIDGSDPN